MIQMITPVAFRPYGTILADTTADCGRAEPLRILQGSAPLYRAAASTRLCNRQGMCVLSVSTDGTSFLDFYLDKPVALREGIWFAVSAVSGPASALLYGDSQSAGVYRGGEKMLLHQSFSITNLYTFFYQEKEAGFVFSGESHPVTEITYVDRGTLHSVADGRHIELKQGEMVLYGPNQWHMQYADVGVAPRFVTISFDARGADLSPLYNRTFCSPEAKRLLQLALSEQERDDRFSADVILNLLSVLLLRLLRSECTEAEGGAAEGEISNENHIVGASQQYIADHVREKLSVPAVARQVQVSPSYLSALYHKHLQISPGEYIRRVKLQECKQLIREGTLNFTQIAALMEYSTVHHFSRQFKEKFGITPSEYARSIK